ncbi:gpi-anchor biosynthetic protein [Colletotrichum truncatum]|uniref:Gpi-anchor biosynthetic protein n=1 Tax=Colletotrichum truncatum TaxID=5467 RepID=A0ACC3YCW4_COLTU|nr:gpi-anchor biosynthetic protein [Colletotrichum truncatum]KAF6783527.1 gpi-anchor biosynthetic protein [Colletotrichum truncatum]
MAVVTTRVRFLAIAMVFHLVYIYSIFDIYFVSPIVTGMPLVPIERSPETRAPADRLVLFVGDGLRADKAFQAFPEPYPKAEDDLAPRHLAPFLRSRVLDHGTFGVSWTRVPTESRPGHVALIAGLYEDVSAVATGWKMNPVNFDSVFNRSRHTWSWGSPDILPMFDHGATPGRIDAYCYAADFEDFTQDSTHLDLWVFDHVKDLFAAAATNKTLNEALRQDKVVFFLHLLGIDTAGHFYRPYSKEYLNNIKLVDQGVKEITELMNEFYADDRTAFVFTADHGMSDWGSHGDGHPDNTRTPLIAWGSGVAKPVIHPADSVAPGHDGYSSDWNLDNVRRHDVAQADVAALMAYLIGVEFPVNSVGELPLSYLDARPEEKAEALLANAKEILEMYGVKERIKKTNQLRYVPYKPLSSEHRTPEQRVQAIRNLIDRGSFEEAIEETATLIKTALEGLRYLQTYDWLFLRALITIGYIGWTAFALTTVVDLHVLQGTTQPQRSTGGTIVFSSILAALFASFMASRSPLTYYAYAFFPVFFWEEVYARRESLSRGWKALFGHITSRKDLLTLVLGAVVYLGIVESLAVGYIHREVLTVLFWIGGFYPLAYGFSFLQKHPVLTTTWFVSCAVMGSFTLLPANKVENITLIVCGGLFMVAVGAGYLLFERTIVANLLGVNSKPSLENYMSRFLIGVQTVLVMLSIIITRSSALSLQAKEGLPRTLQVAGWLVLIVSLLLPLAHQLQPNSHYAHRLMVIFLAFAPTFVILTISYEALFYVFYAVTLLSWIQLESRIQAFTSTPTDPPTKEVQKTYSPPSEASKGLRFRPLRLSDARLALFFFVLFQSAFFSTGNIASISTFSLESVCRLLPVFDPFAQGAMLIFKIMIPFVFVSASLGILNKLLGVAPSALFMFAVGMSDILTLHFFWVVRDEGSWLEIGSTICHFVVASLVCVFVVLMEGVSAMFISGVEV